MKMIEKICVSYVIVKYVVEILNCKQKPRNQIPKPVNQTPKTKNQKRKTEKHKPETQNYKPQTGNQNQSCKFNF